MRIEKENQKIRNPQSEITGPMLFPRNPAKGGTSGPQACFFAEKETAGGKQRIHVDKIKTIGYR
jgi:hypothetical protein